MATTTAAEGVEQLRRIPAPEQGVGRIAAPTLAIFLVALALYAGSCALTLAGAWPWPLSTAVNAVCAFWLFTVSHDAAHNALSSSRRATLWLGRVATFAFSPLAGFSTWRFIHMQHHRFTNEHDGSDPDHYTHSGPRWSLPLRWATIDLHYVAFYARRAKGRPAAEKRELVGTWLALVALVALSVASGHLGDLLVLYVLPMRLAIVFLAWSFDYLPHAGLEGHTQRSNRFRATRNRLGAERLLSPLLLNQNYHLVHHLHPTIPFHRYLQVWRRSERHYLANDPELSDVRGRPLTQAERARLVAMAAEH